MTRPSATRAGSVGDVKDLRLGARSTARIGPWHGDPHTASVATYLDQPLDRGDVDRCLERLAELGYRRAVTAALAPAEAAPFLVAGFSPIRSLVLLRRDLSLAVPTPTVASRRARRRDLDALLDVDAAAFDAFWRLDRLALTEAMEATPRRRLRIVPGAPPLGYALAGCARDNGYLQRLAVAPTATGRGIGTALVCDALRWMRREGALVAWVNTQDDNVRALHLYEWLGFERTPDGLTMLTIDLDRAPR